MKPTSRTLTALGYHCRVTPRVVSPPGYNVRVAESRSDQVPEGSTAVPAGRVWRDPDNPKRWYAWHRGFALGYASTMAEAVATIVAMEKEIG